MGQRSKPWRVASSQHASNMHNVAVMQADPNTPAADPHRWAFYVRRVSRDASQLAISRASGVNQTTISRWYDSDAPSAPSARAVVAIARAYKANVIEALVEGGVMTEADAKLRSRRRIDVIDLSTDELLRELARRAEQGVA